MYLYLSGRPYLAANGISIVHVHKVCCGMVWCGVLCCTVLCWRALCCDVCAMIFLPPPSPAASPPVALYILLPPLTAFYSLIQPLTAWTNAFLRLPFSPLHPSPSSFVLLVHVHKSLGTRTIHWRRVWWRAGVGGTGCWSTTKSHYHITFSVCCATHICNTLRNEKFHRLRCDLTPGSVTP